MLTRDRVKKKMLEGIQRKISFALVLVSAVGWICFDVGLGMEGQSEGKALWRWEKFCPLCFAASGLALYLFCIVYLLMKWRVVAVITLAILAPFLMSAGAVLNSISIGGLNSNTPVYFEAQLAGTAWAIVAMWLSLLLWPYHAKKEERDDYRTLN